MGVSDFLKDLFSIDNHKKFKRRQCEMLHTEAQRYKKEAREATNKLVETLEKAKAKQSSQVA